jgi:hypothetical protein
VTEDVALGAVWGGTMLEKIVNGTWLVRFYSRWHCTRTTLGRERREPETEAVGRLARVYCRHYKIIPI